VLDRHEVKLHVDRHLQEARATMLPRVRVAFDRLLQDRGLLSPDPAPYFGPLGHPLFELPVWLARRLNDEGVVTPREAVSDVLGVSALGYLHARAQDDWLDGGSNEDPTLIAVAEALIALCNQLLVSVVGVSNRFWRFYAQVLNDYAESLLDTAEVRGTDVPISRSTFERLLRQSRPLVIPSAALLDRADRWHLLPGLEDFVLAATASSQLFNDLTDLYRDRDMGHRTWTTDAVAEAGPDGLWLEVARPSSGHEVGRIQERVDAALLYHQQAARAARALELTAAETWLTDREAALEGLLRSLHGNLLATFVRRMTESGPVRLNRRERGRSKKRG
jgi:hypothetical protein